MRDTPFRQRWDAVFHDHEGKRSRRVKILPEPRRDLFTGPDGADDIEKHLREVADALDMDLVLLGHVNERVYTVVALHRRDASYALAPGDQLPIEETYCRQEITADAPFVMGDALADAAFAQHPGFVKHGLRAYAGAPITLPDGTLYGTLCGVDRTTRVPTLAGVERLVEISRILGDEIWTRIRATPT